MTNIPLLKYHRCMDFLQRLLLGFLVQVMTLRTNGLTTRATYWDRPDEAPCAHLELSVPG
jgi:hypothetical protein